MSVSLVMRCCAIAAWRKRRPDAQNQKHCFFGKIYRPSVPAVRSFSLEGRVTSRSFSTYTWMGKFGIPHQVGGTPPSEVNQAHWKKVLSEENVDVDFVQDRSVLKGALFMLEIFQQESPLRIFFINEEGGNE